MSANIAQSVRSRLLNRARERGEDFGLLLNRFAAERILYRLAQSPHRDRFALKGASLLAAWVGQEYRATRDLDIEGFGPSDHAALRDVFRAVCAVAVADDGLTITLDAITVQTIMDEEQYSGARVRIPVRIGGARADVRIDVGFGDAITPHAEEIEYPTLLPFPAPHLRAYPRVTVLAEKWEAIVALGITNSRMKDFFDLWVLAREFAFDGPLVARAIAATFTRRATPLPDSPPAALTATFAADETKRSQWGGFIRRGAVHNAPPTLAMVIEAISSFVMPPTRALATAQPFAMQWQPGGPWRAREASDQPTGA